MEILGIQLLGIIFGLIFTYFTYSNIKKEKLKIIDGALWIIMWFGLVLISINPFIISFIAKNMFSMSRPLDFMIVVSFMIMFGLLYYMYLVVKTTENRVEKLVRNIAIEESSYNKKSIKKSSKNSNK